MRSKLQIDDIPHISSSYEYVHGRKTGSGTAFYIGERARFRVKIPRAIGICFPYLEIFDEATEFLRKLKLSFLKIVCGADIYEAEIPISELGVGLYFMRVTAKVGNKRLYSKRYEKDLFFSDDASCNDLFQLTVSDFKYEIPEKILGGVIYHVFVDRFNRGGRSDIPDTAVMVDGEWDKIPEYPDYPGAPLKNNTFYGGTLFGIADKLDYIASLGVKALYLSPIFKSVSNHRYDTADYMQVDPMLGGEEGLVHLIREAQKRNIVIILDGVFNHTGDDSVYFNRYGRFAELGAYQSKASKFYPWYDFSAFPDKYTCWWNIEILPRINPDISECCEFFVGDKGVISKYRDMGVYGFRLDVADELSDPFIEKIKATLSADGESVLYGEVWEDASNKIAYGKRKKYYLGRELDGVMNYPLRTGIIEYILHKNTSALRYAIEVMNNAPGRVMHAQMNLLGTHDTERILTVLSGIEAGDRSNRELCDMRLSHGERQTAIRRLVAAYTVLATLPGIPAVFYGDEAGLEGYHDPFNRMPYPWGRECEEILSHYRKVGALRCENSVYRKGEFKLYVLCEDILVFSRIETDFEYYTVFNNSQNERVIEFKNSATELLNERRGRIHSLSPCEAMVYRARKNTKFEIF